MGRQRNRPHVKEQGNSPEKELNETEASNLLDIVFRVMIIKILKSMKKDVETIKEGPVRNKERNI